MNATTQQPQAAKILKKITLASIGLDKMSILEIVRKVAPVLERKENGEPKKFAPLGPPVPIAQFIGTVNDIKPVVNKETGDVSVRLIGSYEAINLVTGEAFSNCPVLFLPAFISDSIANAIKEGAKAVDFAVVIDARYDESSAVSYVFEARSLLPASKSNAVEAIKARLLGNGVKLAIANTPKVEGVIEVEAEAESEGVKAEADAVRSEAAEAPASKKARK